MVYLSAEGDLVLGICGVCQKEEGDHLASALREGVVEDNRIVTSLSIDDIVSTFGELIGVALAKFDHLFQTNMLQPVNDLRLV